MKRQYTDQEILDRIKNAEDPQLDEILAQVPDDEISPTTLKRQQAKLMARAQAYMAQESDPKPSRESEPSGITKTWQGTLDEIKRLGEIFTPTPSLAFRRERTESSAASDRVDPDIDWIPVDLYTDRAETVLTLKYRGEHPEQLPKVAVTWNRIELAAVTEQDLSSEGLLLLLIFESQGEIEGVSCNIRLTIQGEGFKQRIIVDIESGTENTLERNS